MRTATIVAGRTLAIAVYAFTLGALWLLAQATPPRLKFDAFAGLGFTGGGTNRDVPAATAFGVMTMTPVRR